MKKIYIVSALLLAVTFVQAQTKTPENGKSNLRAQVSAPPMVGMDGMVMPPVPTTGDSVKDGEIKTLVAERNAKIKAIHDEYATRIKAIVGEKRPVKATTQKVLPVMKKIEGKPNQEQRQGEKKIPPTSVR